MDNKYVQAADVLLAAIESCKELLGANDRLFLGLNHKVTMIANQIKLAGGGQNSNLAAPEFKKVPITEFMGDPITRPTLVKEEEISPEELERKLFIDKIERLEANLDNLDNKAILESYQNEQSVVRGMAKRAGIDSYKDHEFNGEFLDLIRTVRANNAAQAETDAAEQAKIIEAAKANKEKPKKGATDNK